MSIDIVVTEDSELSEVAAAPQEGVRDLPAQRGPYLVRALQRKLNLLLTLFWYPFFHMCLPASSITSLCRPKYSLQV